MARPRDNSLKYYNRDVHDDDNLRYIQSAHGLIGWAIVEKLRQKVYGSPGGYYMPWNAVTERIFCSDNKISLEEFKNVLDSCFLPDIGLFSKEMYEKHKILTSTGIQKRWRKIVTECKRKNSVLNEAYCLIPPEETTLPPVILPNISGGSTQSKVKEMKVKESRVTVPTDSTTPKELSPATAVAVTGGKKLNSEKKQPDKPREHWQALVDTWFGFYKKNTTLPNVILMLRTFR